jgi:hypothetical protein
MSELPELWGVSINMLVYREDGKPLDRDVFFDKFIDFVEANNWFCSGATTVEDLNHPKED